MRGSPDVTEKKVSLNSSDGSHDDHVVNILASRILYGNVNDTSSPASSMTISFGVGSFGNAAHSTGGSPTSPRGSFRDAISAQNVLKKPLKHVKRRVLKEFSLQKTDGVLFLYVRGTGLVCEISEYADGVK